MLNAKHSQNNGQLKIKFVLLYSIFVQTSIFYLFVCLFRVSDDFFFLHLISLEQTRAAQHFLHSRRKEMCNKTNLFGATMRDTVDRRYIFEFLQFLLDLRRLFLHF